MTGRFRTRRGGRIERARLITFTFDGKSLEGYQGDTLASALLANGIHLVGRSFKYHRPRGILSAGAEEPNALVTVMRGGGRETPNLRATQVEIYDGLTAISQNRWPSLSHDAGEISSAFAPLIAAGFYYKTFMGPRFIGANQLWTKLYEPVIRRMAGLGRAPREPDPDRYANQYAHCDVLVVGGGASGLSAALAAAEAGRRVIICDEQSELGGALLSETAARIGGEAAQVWAERAISRLQTNPRVTVLARTQAFGMFAQNFAALCERLTEHLADPPPERARERLWQVRANKIVLATGAIERPLVFPGNDRPGVMLADAARTYVNRYGILTGSRAVVLAACDTAYQAAIDLAKAGVEVAMIADVRGAPSDNPLLAEVRALGIRIETATTITRTRGRLRVSGVEIGRIGSGGTIAGRERIACDLVLMSGGWTPSVHLFSQARGRLAWKEELGVFLPGDIAADVVSVGACNGAFGLAAAIAEGTTAGAAGSLPHGVPSVEEVLAASRCFKGMIGACPASGNAKTPAFVDFQHDVTTKDLALATREGFRAIEHVKRYTTTGMATDQGKTSNINALAIVAEHVGRPIPEVGLTTFRQPYTPVTFGTLAGHSRGDLFDPVRRTPIDPWAQANGAVFEDVGQWKRARYFPRSGETMHTAVARECRTVRTAAGMFDASTLGKIEVAGPDAAEFLERMYVNAVKTLKVGRCRYAALLNEAGFVIDDGIIARVSDAEFHVTTTTGGAASVLNLMEDYLQTEWPTLKVWLTSTTEHWAVIAVQGPKAAEIIAPFLEGHSLGTEDFPHMSVCDANVCGVPARVFRVSFTGEPGFELNVPAGHGLAVWEALWPAVEQVGGCAYGTETMHVLRAEKGYIIVGQETDGTMTPEDVGLGWLIGRKKRDFVGKRSLSRPDMLALGRKELVGLRTTDPGTVLEEGAQITSEARPLPGTSALGHVTSSYWSETLGHSIALALVSGGRSRMGETLYVPMPAGGVQVEIVSPVFYDPKGERLHV
jgi:sarcosine oxidase, subunit alpha